MGFVLNTMRLRHKDPNPFRQAEQPFFKAKAHRFFMISQLTREQNYLQRTYQINGGACRKVPTSWNLKPNIMSRFKRIAPFHIVFKISLFATYGYIKSLSNADICNLANGHTVYTFLA